MLWSCKVSMSLMEVERVQISESINAVNSKREIVGMVTPSLFLSFGFFLICIACACIIINCNLWSLCKVQVIQTF